MWQPFGGLQLDELGYRLLGAVQRTGCKRLFIDGLRGFVATSAFAERGTAFLATLSNELRREGTTTLVAAESDDLHGLALPLVNISLSAIADNVVRLRIEERDGRMRRIVSMGKVRGSRLDLSLRELNLTATGLQMIASDSSNPDTADRG